MLWEEEATDLCEAEMKGCSHERFARRMAYKRPPPPIAAPAPRPEPVTQAPIVYPRLLAHILAFVEENGDDMVSRSREREYTQHTTGNAVRQERMALAMKRGNHEQWEWWRLMCYYGRACAQCGSRDRIHKDHIVPVSRGGSNGLENLQPLCIGCNLSKHDRTADHRWDNWEWVEVLKLGWVVGD